MTAGTTRRRRRRRRGRRGRTWGSRRRHICISSPGMFFLLYFYTILIFFHLDYVYVNSNPNRMKNEWPPSLLPPWRTTQRKRPKRHIDNASLEPRYVLLFFSLFYYWFLLLDYQLRVRVKQHHHHEQIPKRQWWDGLKMRHMCLEPLVRPSLYHHWRMQRPTNTPAKRLQPTAMSKKRPKRCVQTCRLGHRYVFLIIISCFWVLYTNYLYFRHEEGPKRQTSFVVCALGSRCIADASRARLPRNHKQPPKR